MTSLLRSGAFQSCEQLAGRAKGKIRKPKRNLAVMNRRKWGLYGGKHVIFGNNVSHSVRRTRRMWKPNVQRKKLWSDALDRWVRLRVTTYALRSIDKAGGLDNYLLHPKRHDLDSVVGQQLKELVLARLAEIEQEDAAAEAAAEATAEPLAGTGDHDDEVLARRAEV